MFNGMMDPELMRMAQEQMSRMSPAELARMQQQMMSNPELIRMASESMQNLRPEDLRNAAEQLKHTRPEDIAQIGEKMANSSPEEIAAMRSRMDAQMSYEINAAEMLKKQGNEFHNQGKYKDALEKYTRAKNNLKNVPSSRGKNILLACSLNIMSCYLKTNQYDGCITEGTEVLAYDARNVKALYRRGQAYKELGRLGDAVSDLRKALEVSPDDETIADVLRDAEERLTKEGDGHRSGGIIIEDITEETTASSESCENSTLDYSTSPLQETSQCSTTSQTAKLKKTRSTDTDYMGTIKDDPESIRSFQSFMSQADPETLAAMSSGNVEGISPDMLKTASNVIGKMSPEELNRMFQLSSSFQGGNPFSNSSSGSNPRSFPSDMSPDMLKTASDMMSKMSPEDLQKMFEMASSLKQNDTGSNPRSVPPDMSPDMLKTASDMMSKMSPQDLQKMFEMASSLKQNDTSSSSATGSQTNPGLIPPNMNPDMIKMATDMMGKMSPEERQKMLGIASSLRGQESTSSTATSYSNVSNAGESSSSQNISSRSSQSNVLNSDTDLQEQMRNQMKNPAMRQMLTSMMKNMNPEMMANMSEQLGFKLSREDAEKAQQAMASLSPEALDSMMKWADWIQRGAEGARKTKNWLLGRPGMIMAICMLLLAVILQWFGFIGK